jgi:hypothetical protein
MTTNATEFGSIVGDMYSRWTLDCIIELAHGVADDFIVRPRLYQGDDIPVEIADLRMSYATSRDFPNTQQRLMMHLPIFGRSDGLRPDGSSSGFHAARKKLIDASVAYSERIYETGLAMLKERIRSAVIPLNSHLQSMAGRSLEVSASQGKSIFDLATGILTSRGVAKVFGIDPTGGGWPLNSDDSNGAKLVEAIGMTLRLSPECVLTLEKFSLLQRVAREGREALVLILQPDSASDEKLEPLITKAYTWGTSLRDFQT